MKICVPSYPSTVLSIINLLITVYFCLGWIHIIHFSISLHFSVDRRVCSILSYLVLPFLAISLDFSSKYIVFKVALFSCK